MRALFHTAACSFMECLCPKPRFYGTLVPQTYKNKAPAVIRVRRSRTSAKFAAGAFVVLNAKMPPAGKRLMALLPYGQLI